MHSYITQHGIAIFEKNIYIHMYSYIYMIFQRPKNKVKGWNTLWRCLHSNCNIVVTLIVIVTLWLEQKNFSSPLMWTFNTRLCFPSTAGIRIIFVNFKMLSLFQLFYIFIFLKRSFLRYPSRSAYKIIWSPIVIQTQPWRS